MVVTIENTAQYSWLLEMCRTFFQFHDERITESNWERLYDSSLQVLSAPNWEQTVIERSGLDGVFFSRTTSTIRWKALIQSSMSPASEQMTSSFISLEKMYATDFRRPQIASSVVRMI